MKLKYVILILVMAGLTSCKDFLDTKPTSFITPGNYYSTGTQLQTALNSVYDVITNGGALYGFNADMLFRWAYTCDESTARLYPENTFSYDAGSNSARLAWQALYAGIERANLLLANLDNASVDQGQKNIIKGQALFLRGYFYYLLVVCYGDVPLIIDPTQSVTGDVSVARTPVKAVYAQILSDMAKAEDLLGKANFTAKSLGYAEKVTVDAVQGFLAKVCLTMASPGASGIPVDVSKYEDAITWADKLITSPDHTLITDYKQVFINLMQDKYDVRESIWEAGLYGTSSTEGSNYTMLIGITNSPGGGQAAYVTKKLVDSYAVWDSVRSNWNCPKFFYKAVPVNFSPVTTPVTSPWYIQAGKFRRMYESTFVGLGGSGQSAYNSTNIPLLRLADVYLMKAEAENQVNGATKAAYDAINAVRRRAFKVPINLPNAVCDLSPNLDKNAFMDSLKVERMRELCFEGIRKWDQVRWGSFVTDMQNLLVQANATFPSGTPTGLNPNMIRTILPAVSQKHFLLPIPSLELQLNNKLIQNPGW
ncbi:RagB/SusD family nutrient uptake outer membrane protein [Pedobacter hiemivivus]|uniref:RagB/SusD family nutrient uptake outer membrane protein n=2 Tax=Pedobacter hiemivivus TaxID=2530454 RepID=A0A4U1GH90_9SPHI|nr:RagB/SusD family nutrient uptake outer membrane protein [Pedobacter hiemivivus]TKC63595.1 RagB/SusD family nutrient uptake outer membrane protein [Pedobacter hiemivivus]